MFTNKIVKRIQESTVVMSIMRQSNKVEVIIIVGVKIIGDVMINGESIFNDAPFRKAHSSMEFTT